MATNFRREIGRNRRHTFLLGTRIPQWIAGWESDWALLTAQKSCLHHVKIWWTLVHCGDYGDYLCAKCAKFAKRVRFLGLAFDNGWQEPLNGFALNSHGRRVWSFAWISLNLKIKSQRSRSPGTKTCYALTTPPRYGKEWNALVTDNVAQATGVTIRSL